MTDAARAPVVLLHALGVSGRSWWPVASLLPERQVLALDLPGHGGQRLLGSSPDRIDAWAEAVVDQLSAKGISDMDRGVHLVGMSLGGLVAARVAARYPNLVESLVLVATTPTYPPVLRQLWKDRAASVPKHGLASVLQPTLELWFTSRALDEDDPVVELVRSELLDADPRGYADACALLSTVDVTESLREIGCPTSVVWGQDDAAAFQQGARQIGVAIPGAELNSIPNGRHGAALERAEAFKALLSEHFARSERAITAPSAPLRILEAGASRSAQRIEGRPH